jgi:hypothetical protein
MRCSCNASLYAPKAGKEKGVTFFAALCNIIRRAAAEKYKIHL